MSCSYHSVCHVHCPQFAVFRALVEFYQKPFLNIVAFTMNRQLLQTAKTLSSLYILVALQMAVEVFRGQHPVFWKKTYSNMTTCKFLCWKQLFTIHMLKNLNVKFEKFKIITQNWKKISVNCSFTQRFDTSKMHLSPRWLRLLSVLRLWFCCWDSVIGLCFVVRYFNTLCPF